MKEVVSRLIEEKKTIATMESATAGALASAITNIEGASEILKFSAITYSNEYKIKMGVDPEIIAKYSVYSTATAMEMSKKISLFANSDIGVGITGKLNRPDKENQFGSDSKVFVSIYLSDQDNYENLEIEVDPNKNREENKKLIVKKVEEKLKEILKEER